MGQSDRAGVETEILRANAAFYRAFTHGDYAAMADLWAHRAPVACLHPASPVLNGRQAVLASWREILRTPPSFEMRCDRPVVQVLGETAVVTCYEGNGSHPAHLAATNVFVHEEGSWRMVHHHAGPLARPISNPPPAHSPLN
jgi:ketosteroid isomerase-like protein